MSARDVLATNIDPAVPADMAQASIDAYHAEVLREAADAMTAQYNEDGAELLLGMARVAEQAGKDTREGESTRAPLGQFVGCALGCFSGEWEGRALERGWTATPAGLICPQHNTERGAQRSEAG